MITLVLGGARSGKSAYAERLADAGGGAVTYVATASSGGDRDFEARILRHRERRPESWATAEPGADLVGWVESDRGGSTLLVDSLGTWVAACDGFRVDGARLCRALAVRPGAAVIVSEEVGMGVHPPTDVGVRFRDALGELNQVVAAVADEVHLVVAGRGLRLERAG